jgi:YD repeat-containing protein
MNSLYKKISEYPDTWQIFQGEFEGKPISVCFREGVIRPEHVVGSYAVYATEPSEGSTGKVGHIYRPHIYDSVGNETWGTLTLEDAKGEVNGDAKRNSAGNEKGNNGVNRTLTVTVPPAFLENAVYPITIDPTIGYTTVGASQANMTDAVGTRFTMPSHAGTLQHISLYTKAVAGTVSKIAALYSDVSGVPTTRLSEQTTPYTNVGTTPSWITLPMNRVTLSTSTAYWLWQGHSAQSAVYFDSGATNQYNATGISYPVWPSTLTPGIYDPRIMSAYATYATTSGSGGGTSTVPGKVTQHLTYSYDARGNIIQVVDRSNTNTVGTTTYGYDSLARLTSATHIGSVPYTETYTYDALGNITNQSGTVYTYAQAGYANPMPPRQ